MYIEQLLIKNYRNYPLAELNFENKVNVIIGENAQGKTNLMEAIYVLALSKSHRTSKDKELIGWDKEYAKIEGSIKKDKGLVSLQLVLSNKGKKAKINFLEQKKLSNYIGTLNVVMFAPEDLNLVKGSPQVRRRFLDMEIGQVMPVYMYDLMKYQKILQQRNHFLKARNKDMTMFDVMTAQLTESAVKVHKRRVEFIKLLQEWAEPIHYKISRGLEKLEIQYKPSLNVSDSHDLSKMIEEYLEKFDKMKDKEFERGITLVGPHRDDLEFFVNGKNVQVFGSQGQQRTTALSLKLAEIDLMYSEIGEYPILLLDDVLSELDDFRQSHLLHAIQGKVQTFVTTTSVDGIDHKTLHEADMFAVENGTVKKVK